MKIGAIIQARMGSSRLPGKVLKPLGGTTVLGCVIERLRVCRFLDSTIVATSALKSDDRVVAEALDRGALVSRGPENDVLTRFFEAAAESALDAVVRITADCPLIDPQVIDAMIRIFQERPCDYLSNTLSRSYPRGLDVEIFRFAALERAFKEAFRPDQREHVTPYLYQNREIFRLQNYADPSGADRSSMRWTLDADEDYRFLSEIYDRIPGSPAEITTSDVLALLAREPWLAQINAAVAQKELGT